ncbi:DUF2235 domain-containing protein [Novosphingobium album (ex Liu et al. 2023)]|uniref:DUF2235 domain-containing protein n=1 Tax=Novosphingobium album (ex Liu et al. 2023) TaxID=3031130 RepID=A0ABT5WWP3_9SPHN|nr:DUF2235 domain-containing protein [Novosphingobium album (ex Liu et al. 2023)]MDE8654330.1 DUF2235 domain-containing protein [Novosphingobium album (ex Liu et al. 2023)]
MARNIIVCCDGTSNQPSNDATNVAKLTEVLVKDPAQQLVYYHPGLGTMAAPGFTTRVGSWGARTAGLALGYGLKDDLRDAYIYIMNHWRPGDRLFLFGFSRGAYTVRALASLIRLYGLAMAGNEALVPYAVQMMWPSNDGEGHFDETMRKAKQFKVSLTTGDCPIYFMGVWDTVSSVGWINNPVSFPHTRTNDAIAHVRHAVAIDERRAFFRTNLFDTAPGQDLRQVWFPGDHCDVGGGYPEAESGMSKYPLEWMISEAAAKGLLIDPVHAATILGKDGSGYSEAKPDAELHDSMTGFWPALEYVSKRHWNKQLMAYEHIRNRGRRRDMGQAPIVHDVAWLIPGYAARLPADAIPLSKAF